MKKEANIRLLVSKTEESLAAARELLAKGHYGFSASRSYYAIFYAAEAALLHRDLQFSKHSAVIAGFNREFVKDGTFDAEMFKAFQRGFDLRIAGDYGMIPLEEKEARSIIVQGGDFIRRVKEYLGGFGYDFSNGAGA